MQSPNLHAAPHSLINVHLVVRGAQWPPKTFFADGKREIKRKEGRKDGNAEPVIAVRLLGRDDRLRRRRRRRCSNGAFGPTAKIEVSSPDDVRALLASRCTLQPAAHVANRVIGHASGL